MFELRKIFNGKLNKRNTTFSVYWTNVGTTDAINNAVKATNSVLLKSRGKGGNDYLFYNDNTGIISFSRWYLSPDSLSSVPILSRKACWFPQAMAF